MKDVKKASEEFANAAEEQIDGIDVKSDEEDNQVSEPSEAKGAKAKKVFTDFVHMFITAERVIGLVLILLVPCFCAAWIHIPLIEQFGINAELSLPDALSAGSKVAGAIEKTGSGISVVKDVVNDLADITEEAASIASAAKTALNATPDERKAKLMEATSNLVGSFVDEATAEQASEKAAAAKETATDVADKASEVTQNAQNVTDKAQTVVDKAAENNANALKIVKGILGAVSSVWYLFLILLLVAGVLLFAKVRGRYVTGIVALSISAVASLATVIGAAIVDGIIMDALADTFGAWIATLIPSIVAVTAWPWITAIAAIVCLVILCIRLKRYRAQLKAAKEAQQPALETASEKQEAAA